MVNAAVCLHRASYLCPSELLWQRYATEMTLYRNASIPKCLYTEMPLYRNASISKCTQLTGSGRHRQGEIPKANDVLTDAMSMLRVANTRVPSIFLSNGIRLSNFTGDKQEWPVYMTIGNPSSKIHQMPSTYSIEMVTLLPIPIKHRNVPQKRLDEQWRTKRELLTEVLWQVLQSLTLKQNASAERRYYNILCADGNVRCCKPVLAESLADCLCIATNIISSGMPVFEPSVHRTKLEIRSPWQARPPAGSQPI